MLKFDFEYHRTFTFLLLLTYLLPLRLFAQDVTPPNVISTAPINAETGVRLNQTFFSVSFDDEVKYVSGEWRIVKTATNEVIKTVTPNQSSYYSSWQNVYFANGLLEENTGYQVEIDAGAYEDEAGNAFAGTQWTFTTEVAETDLPLISSLSPTNGSTGVSIGQKYFSITFNEHVTPVSGDWRLIKSTTDEVIKTVSLNANDNYQSSWSVSFNSDLLEAFTEYYIEVDADAYEDVFGNKFEGIDDKTNWTFTTQDPESVAPEWSFFSPADNSTNISLNQRSFSISFNEQVTYVSGDWRLVETATGTVAKTATPSTSSSYDSWWSIYFSDEFLKPDTEYHIEVDAGSYEDLFGNVFGGVSSGDWTFTTQEAETTAPIAISFNPVNEGTNVPITQTYFGLSFDEGVQSQGGEVRLVKTSTGATIKTQTLSAGTFFSSFHAFSFDRGLLETSTQYHIEIDAGTYEDIFGNAFAGISDETVWSFTTMEAETDAPEITSLDPAHNTTEIEITRNYFRIDFDEEVVANSGQWRLIKTSTGQVVKTATITSNSYYDDDWAVNFTSGLLETSTQYHIEVDAGTYEDVFGNDFAGISDETVWSFTTQAADTDPPLISSLSPSHEATNISISNTYFQIQFDEAVARSAGQWRLVKTSTDETVKTASFSANTNFSIWHTVYFPSGLLEASTQYHIEMDAGLYEDVFGNEFAAVSDVTTWSFTTQPAETDAPEIVSLSPSNNATNVGIDQTLFSIIFNEHVTFTSGTAYLVNADTEETIKTAIPNSHGFDTWQYVQFPDGFLEPDTEYYILIDEGTYEDAFGNEFAGIDDETVWSFTTQEEEFDAPVIQSSSPSNSSTGIDISTTYFWARFDENVKYVKGEWQLINTGTGEVVKTKRPNSSSIYRDFHSISFSNGLLEPSTQYHLEIEQGAFEDIFGNEFAGLSDEASWSFTTQDAETDPPTLVSFSPRHEATDQDLVNLRFDIEFNEPVQYVEGLVFLIETSTGKIVKTTSPSSGGFFYSTSFSFPDGPLKSNTQYHIEIDEGAYEDLFGNEFAGIDDETVWSFTTKPSEADAPVLDRTFPDHNDTGVSINQTYFSMTFDELVKFEGGVLSLVKTSTDEVVKYATPLISGEYSERSDFYFPQGLLEPSTQYHLEIGNDVLSDFFDNSFGGISDETIWSFTTQATETTAPQISAVSPTDNSTGLSIYNSYYYINFDEPVAYGDGEMRLVKTSTGEVLGKVSTSQGTYYTTGWNINFDHSTLESFTDYHIEIDEGTFVDVFGNLFYGFDDATTWNFTTRDSNAPVFSSGSLVYTDENSVNTGYSAQATDDNGVTYSFSGNGADEAIFEIDSNEGTINFISSPDYESPNDEGGDNGYVVEVLAVDNQGNSARLTVVFIVEDLDEDSPVIDSELEFSIEENSQTIAVLPSVIDDSEVTFSLNSFAADSDLFTIDASNGEISFRESPDYENPSDSNVDNVYEASLAVTDDAGNTAAVTVKITVTDIDEVAPVFTSASSATFSENGVGVVYETATTDGLSVTYKLSGNEVDESLFTIEAESGKLYFISSPNFEIPGDGNEDNIYEINITATDSLGNISSHAVSITVENVVESLSFISAASASINENTTQAYTANATSDRAITYGIVEADKDQGLFNIDSATGEVTFISAPDFENPLDGDTDNVYELTLMASDEDGNSVTIDVAITVEDLDENKPVFISDTNVEVVENSTGAVYLAVATDQSAITYSLTKEDTDNDLFEIELSTGKVSFKTAPDYETPTDADANNVYEISVTATDQDGLTATQSVQITVTDYDEDSPVFISVANADFLENKVGVAYQAIATDENEVTYAMTGEGEDEALFTLDIKSGQVSFIESPDYENPGDQDLNNSYEIVLKATDGLGYTAQFAVSIAVLGENDNEPIASRVAFTGYLFADQLLTGEYEFYDLDGDEEDGTTFQWYRSADGSLDDLTLIEGANELNYQTSALDELTFLVLEVIPSDGMLTGVGYFSEAKYIDREAEVLNVEPSTPTVKILDLGTGAVRVKFPSQENREILVYSLEGKVERREMLSGDTLDLEFLKPGVWLMKYIEQNGNLETMKFLVN